MNKEKYIQIRKWIEKGKLQLASENLRSLRDEAPILHKLLSIRLALKLGNLNVDLDISGLEREMTQDPFEGSELMFVKGLLAMATAKYLEAEEWFMRAGEYCRQIPDFERELMSKYNILIAQLNAGKLNSEELYLERLLDLERLARGFIDNRVLGLVLRQKSYFYFSSKKWNAAFQDIVEALPHLELFGSKSDFHLGLVHAANISVELGKGQQAKAYLEKVVGEVEERVKFPLAMVQGRIQNELIGPEKFTSVSKFWLDCFQSIQRSSQSSHSDSQIWGQLKEMSLEGRLIKILESGKRNKMSLTEQLWPELSDIAILDNRLHRLISRVNKKLGNVIAFDGAYYSLKRQQQSG